jgi:hypothetical protein
LVDVWPSVRTKVVCGLSQALFQQVSNHSVVVNMMTLFVPEEGSSNHSFRVDEDHGNFNRVVPAEFIIARPRSWVSREPFNRSSW